MRRLVGWLGLLCVTLPSGVSVNDVHAAENWSPVVIPTGEYRAKIQSTPIPERPGRLLHVYGNAVRWIESTDQAPLTYRPIRRIVVGTDGIRQNAIPRRAPALARPRR